MDLLKVKGNRIVDTAGNEVWLRGTCLGAWLNMEDFMDCTPGAEHMMRYNAKNILGDEMGEYWFDSFILHFFSEGDAKFLADNGCKVVRVPLNYRHFEDDMNPYVYKEKGFAEVDRLLDICEKYGIYVILDMHAAPGGQSSDWHCDNAKRFGLLWTTPEYRNRFVKLWGEFARRYKDKAVVAAYDILNEPMTNQVLGRLPIVDYYPDWELMNTLYREVTEEIRKYDQNHILFLEGDFFSALFEGMEAPFDDNTAYSSHNYSSVGGGFGNPNFVETRSEEELLQAYRDEFYAAEGTKFAQKYNVPLWISEFGMNKYQLQVFEEFGAHWTNWSYKTANRGMAYPKPDSKYHETIAPVMTKLTRVGNHAPTPERQEMQKLMFALSEAFTKSLGDDRVPAASYVNYVISHSVDDIHYSPLLQQQFMELFKGMTKEQIDEVMASWSFENCEQDTATMELCKKYW